MASNDRIEELLSEMYAEETSSASPEMIDEEWRKFEAKHFPKTRHFHMLRLQKIAAAVVGILFVAGIAFAAFHLIAQHPTPITSHPRTSAPPHPRTPNTHHPTPIVFDNVRLDSVMQVVAAHYGKQVVWGNDSLRNLRFLVTWDDTAPLHNFILLMNNFEGIQLREEGETITIE